MHELMEGMEINLGISWCFSKPDSVAVSFQGPGYSIKVDFQSKQTGKLWSYCPYVTETTSFFCVLS